MALKVTCVHLERTPEAVEMTLEDALDHFLHCFPRAKQLEYWRYFREEADVARHCRMADHEQLYDIMRNQIANHKD